MSRRDWIAVSLLLAAGLTAAFLANNYILHLGAEFCMYGSLGLAWNVIGGFAGYPFFGTAAFFGLGAYVTAIAQSHGISLAPAVFAAGCLTSLFAALLGSAILHLRGHYFAIASLVVADALREVTNNWIDLTGGGMGVNLPLIPGSPTEQARFILFAMGIVLLGALAVGLWLERSKLGVALRCIEQNETAAPLVGIDTRMAKVAALTLASFFMGMIGGLYAAWVSYIDPSDVFDVGLSVKPIIIALIGGPGTAFGPLIGAALYLFLEEVVWRNFINLHEGILGLLVVLLVIFVPEGVGTLRRYSLVSVTSRFFRKAVAP